MIVTLTAGQKTHALEVARGRQAFADGHKLRDRALPSESKLDDSIMGCLGEFAVALVLDLPWHANIGVLDRADVGDMVDVRARRVPGSGTDLVIFPKDPDDRPFVQTLVRPDDTVELVGWLHAHEGKARGQWFERARYWYVRPPYRDILELMRLTKEEVKWRTSKTTAARALVA